MTFNGVSCKYFRFKIVIIMAPKGPPSALWPRHFANEKWNQLVSFSIRCTFLCLFIIILQPSFLVNWKCSSKFPFIESIFHICYWKCNGIFIGDTFFPFLEVNKNWLVQLFAFNYPYVFLPLGALYPTLILIVPYNPTVNLTQMSHTLLETLRILKTFSSLLFGLSHRSI